MTDPVLEARGLTRRFGDVAAVKDLTITVRRGEVYGFLGPNGAGKTTSIRMMAGLLKPTAGSVRVLGEDVGPDRGNGARRRLGVCPQENVLYPELTARENLEYAAALFDVPRRARRERAERVLDLVGLAEKSKARAKDLSGGMKRRLTMGIAIVHEPDVVVLDEPEAGLDPQSRVQVREFIRDLARSHTVVLTSHNMDEVERMATRVGIIDHGTLIQEGTPTELKSKLGAGDTLEVTVSGANGTTAASGPGAAEAVAAALRAVVAGEVHVLDGTVTLRGLDLARKFPIIVETVQKQGVDLEDVRYRGNTLEDVFIHLTGRGLRE